MTTSVTSAGVPKPNRIPLILACILVATLIALGVVYLSGLELMVHWWERDEYSHGYMIPVVALFLLWQRLPKLVDIKISGNWLGPLLLLVALAGWALGELSALYTIVQYAFLLAVYAVVLAVVGAKGVLVLWAPLAYLIFMIPLPNFLYNNLSQQLQLISSELGVWVIRQFGISVYLSGNVIDLGAYKLQVVEACSGLRYLFPLMSFGFLIAYLYRGPQWHKWLIFLSTMPITVLMNSFRIGVIGITVKHWGTEMAEGFLHDFEGWVVFMACLGLLCLEIWLLNLTVRDTRSPLDRIDVSSPSVADVRQGLAGVLKWPQASLIACLLIAVAAIPVSGLVTDREEITPQRSTFASFPLLKGEWMGRESAIDAPVLEELKLTDYIKADYRRGSHEMPVNLYVAYYDSQRKGSSIHSPRSCIPGGGWVISSHTTLPLRPASAKQGIAINRLLISKGNYRQLVYYWFDQRGRVITNEYLAKWFLFWDSLTMGRSDGALVRLVTPIPEDARVEDADQRMQAFIDEFYGLLPQYIPIEVIDGAPALENSNIGSLSN